MGNKNFVIVGILNVGTGWFTYCPRDGSMRNLQQAHKILREGRAVRENSPDFLKERL